MSTENNNYSYLRMNGLSSMILKDSSISSSIEKDAGFCSGSSENGDDYRVEHSRDSPRSLTDASEDSVEVKYTPITIPKNKRKSNEPSKVICESSYPLKKRMKFEEKFRMKTSEVAQEKKVCLFRPWAFVNEKEPTSSSSSSSSSASPPPPLPSSSYLSSLTSTVPTPNPAQVFIRHPGVTTLHRPPNTTIYNQQVQDEPLALLAKKPTPSEQQPNSEKNNTKTLYPTSNDSNNHVTKKGIHVPSIVKIPSVQNPPLTTSSIHSSRRAGSNPPPISPATSSSSSCSSSSNSSSCSNSNVNFSNSSSNNRPSQQRNYKNMTRERRIEANARERTRVHTISAAFETLRKAIPSYSDTQKLSKLSVLRVACSYILTLGRIVGHDYSADQSAPSIAECVDEMAKIIESDGKIRKKKDEE